MTKIHAFFRRNFYLISGAVVVGSIYASFGQFTDAVVGYVAGLLVYGGVEKVSEISRHL